MYAMQTTTSLTGSSRNNLNEGREDAQQMRETAAAKAENRATKAGMHSPADRPQGLYARHEMPERAPHGHPLGGGHPKRVPQEFCDTFHSVREDQSDMASDSKSETEVEEWDDIIAYDTQTSRYTTVAD